MKCASGPTFSEFKPNFEFASIEVKLSKMTDFYLE